MNSNSNRKTPSSMQLAEAIVSRYAREIDKLQRQPKLQAKDLTRLRELRIAADTHARLARR